MSKSLIKNVKGVKSSKAVPTPVQQPIIQVNQVNVPSKLEGPTTKKLSSISDEVSLEAEFKVSNSLNETSISISSESKVEAKPMVQKAKPVPKVEKQEEEIPLEVVVEQPVRVKKTIQVSEEIQKHPKLGEMYAKQGGQIEIDNYDGGTSSTFESMNLDAKLLNNIFIELKWQLPSPIQGVGLVPLTEGRDLLAQAPTGTGKTGAYGVATVQRLIKLMKADKKNFKGCQAIILSPARELTNQIFDVLCKLTKNTSITVASHIGGGGIPDSRGAKYNHNVKDNTPLYNENIVVACVGRLDFLSSKFADSQYYGVDKIDLSKVKLLILDEADTMLSAGNIEGILHIVESCPDNIQTALYSATISDAIRDISTKFLENAVTMLIKKENISMENIRQFNVKTKEESKIVVVENVLKVCGGQVVIFCNRVFRVDYLYEEITKMGIKVGRIHGEMLQSDRTKAMDEFHRGVTRVLIGTEVISRGIDTVVNLVINFDLPLNVENYVHRCGRTGRFASEGRALNILTDTDGSQLNTILYHYPKIKFETYTVFLSILSTSISGANI